jgi:hypothetical protein
MAETRKLAAFLNQDRAVQGKRYQRRVPEQRANSRARGLRRLSKCINGIGTLAPVLTCCRLRRPREALAFSIRRFFLNSLIGCPHRFVLKMFILMPKDQLRINLLQGFGPHPRRRT